MPLDVAFCALQQEGEGRRSLGVRLLALVRPRACLDGLRASVCVHMQQLTPSPPQLINLGSTTLLDFPMFLNAASTRVSGLPVAALEHLFAALPATRTTAQFKVHLCRTALGGSSTAAKGRAKPQARARPPPRRRVRAEATGASASADAVAVSQDASTGGQEPGVASVARKYPAISTSDVLELLTRPSFSDSGSALQGLCFKSELVVNYGLVQQRVTEGDRDEAWTALVRDGGLHKLVEEAFDSETINGVMDAEDQAYVHRRRAALLAIISVWQL